MSVNIKKKFALSTLTLSCLLAFNAQAATDCSNIEEWDKSKSYNSKSIVQKNNTLYTANWWSQGNDPETHSKDYQEWTKGEQCETDEVTPPAIENNAPSIALLSPSANDTLTAGETVTIKADAQDSDGTIKKVVFLVNGSIIDSVTQAPYQITWTAEAGQ